MIKFHPYHPFKCSLKKKKKLCGIREKTLNQTPMTVRERRVGSQTYCITVHTGWNENYWMCPKQTENRGRRGRSAPPDSDEIHVNVMTISVCSPPGCIFAKEEKEKKKEKDWVREELSPPSYDWPLRWDGVGSNNACHTWKTRHLLELVCTLS